MTEEMFDGPLTDADILHLIEQFEAWQSTTKISSNAGLWQMLSFLRNSIENGKPLYSRILDRQREKAMELAKLSGSAPFDATIAADYLSERLHGDIAKLDYDGVFLICGDYFESTAKIPGTYLVAHYNSIFGPYLLLRLVNYWSVYRQGKQGHIGELECPIINDILFVGFNLPMYVDSMQFGQGAWGEGADIVACISKHIRSPASQGQLCSLTPPDVPVPVDWRSNGWARNEIFLDLEFSGDQPLPNWVKDMMRS
ncbi:hypothetical protein JJJ17_11955 [Paracoccus caeni]|uniref:Uncharacterized protein n=1 Tax=Paracoccus caeni TaxID=657651 RepID=A0A934SGK1_9RHOB|nr:hypothetical protein [Paracoccus caeni]MBK4216641.1 hypothetical protein [Paracoccus caeni]